MRNKKKYMGLILSLCMVALFCSSSVETVQAQSNIPNALASFDGLDDSVWERVSTPGFGNDNNFSVVAMAEYQDRLYAMTRNQSQGAEVWRTDGTGWEQVLFPNVETNGIYGNPFINNVWGRMIVFDGKLYFGFSSGLQGSFLGSTGCEIWRYDGTVWEPVISDKRAVEEAGTLSSIASCAAGDGTSVAYFNDSSKAWTADEWAGGVLTITSGTGQFRKFRIIANSATQLTVQQNEQAGTYTDGVSEGEYSVCAEKTYNNMFPRYSYTLGAIHAGDSYEINTGWEQNGFGDMWNKTITGMVVFNDTLYVSTGLNYESGGQVWYSADGDTWQVTSSSITATEPYTYHSFGNFHAAQTGYPGSLKPVSSSVTSLVVSSVSGTPTLYAGGTGTTGPSGGCARLAQLTAGGWEMVVDNNVDADTGGSNENGFGSPPDCGTNEFNFMPWGLADFLGELVVSVSGQGARVLRAPALVDPATESMLDNGRWIYSVGSGNVDPDNATYADPLGSSIYPNGFDGYTFSDGTNQNISTNLFTFGDTLFGGTISFYVPEWNVPADMNELLGAQLWRSPNGMTWTQVTDDAFGDSDTVMFEAFTVFDGMLYVSGSKGASSTPSGLGGAQIYRMAYEPCVTIVPDQTLADKFERYTVAGITTPLPGPDPNPPGYIGAAFLRVADLDGDGSKEIVVTSGSGPSAAGFPFMSADSSVSVFKRTSEDLSTWTQSVIRADFAWANDLLLRDVDDDGDADIMVFDNFIMGSMSNQPAGIHLLMNLGGEITEPGNWEKITLYAKDPAELGIDAYEKAKRRSSYHQGYFVDLDGDGRDDLVTTRISMEIWMSDDPLMFEQQYMWTEWFRAETDLTTYPSGFSGPYDIGDGIGFLMEMHDVDDDGLLDVIGPQFLITTSSTLNIKGSPDGSDPYGDSLVWFKNPGQAVLDSDPNYAWERFTIDNWYTSSNPVGRAFMLFPADITNDGNEEFIAVGHNHQDYVDGERIWPAGIYYLDIPENPYDSTNWNPITIDAGDAYLVDRSGGPFGQGSPGTTVVDDITGNGLSDIVVAGDGRGAVYYYEAMEADADCSLKFGRATLYDDPASMPAEVKVYDLDGDGELEVLATVYDTSFAKNSSSGSVFIWKKVAEPGCSDNSDCEAGYGCQDGVCIEDRSPEFWTRPLWAGPFVRLSTDPAAPHIPQPEHIVFWAYDDDGLTCSGSGIAPENRWMYRPIELQDGAAVPLGDWVEKTPQKFMWYVWIDAPTVAETLAPGLYEFKMQVTDCLGQVTDSEGFWGERYYILIEP